MEWYNNGSLFSLWLNLVDPVDVAIVYRMVKSGAKSVRYRDAEDDRLRHCGKSSDLQETGLSVHSKFRRLRCYCCRCVLAGASFTVRRTERRGISCGNRHRTRLYFASSVQSCALKLMRVPRLDFCRRFSIFTALAQTHPGKNKEENWLGAVYT